MSTVYECTSTHIVPRTRKSHLPLPHAALIAFYYNKEAEATAIHDSIDGRYNVTRHILLDQELVWFS